MTVLLLDSFFTIIKKKEFHRIPDKSSLKKPNKPKSSTKSVYTDNIESDTDF